LNMKNRYIYSVAVGIFCLAVIMVYRLSITGSAIAYDVTHETTYNKFQLKRLYNQMLPSENKPSYEVFSSGITGYNSIVKEGKLQNRQYLTLIDFSLPSIKKRLWVIDLESMRVIYHTLVAHGKNTGKNYAMQFSNIAKSNMSSLGFFITGDTYNGKHGYSLRLEGIEEKINDNARKRAIVIHGANYASEQFIATHGRLGRSFGCPALPTSNYKPIINAIKDKTCLFIYFPDESYFLKSKYVSSI
jgi:hypothetical protein